MTKEEFFIQKIWAEENQRNEIQSTEYPDRICIQCCRLPLEMVYDILIFPVTNFYQNPEFKSFLGIYITDWVYSDKWQEDSNRFTCIINNVVRWWGIDGIRRWIYNIFTCPSKSM